MGNCMASTNLGGKVEEAVVDVLREEDYEFLEYKPPVRVHDVLIDNPGCYVAIESEGREPLPADREMRPGVPYILIKKKRGEGNLAKKDVLGGLEPAGEKGGLRVRVTLTKEELALLLSKCGGDLSSLQLIKGSSAILLEEESSCLSSDRWKPMLDTIHEDLSY
ncbi:hypothetical protein EJ110_NYTH06108 [Nymphaea thermarum]|nr:hypothetical protein EJ110_NYTH06108 [Nymphaea thermarum]